MTSQGYWILQRRKKVISTFQPSHSATSPQQAAVKEDIHATLAVNARQGDFVFTKDIP